jgi:hypothetical protein
MKLGLNKPWKEDSTEMNIRRRTLIYWKKTNCVPGSFDFSIKTLGDSIGARHHGHYDNLTLIRTAFEIIIELASAGELYLNNGDTVIRKRLKRTTDRSFDIVFKNEGYTIGSTPVSCLRFVLAGWRKPSFTVGLLNHISRRTFLSAVVFASDLDATEANARQLLLSAASCARLIPATVLRSISWSIGRTTLEAEITLEKLVAVAV